MAIQVLLKQRPTEGRSGVLVATFDSGDESMIKDIIAKDARVLRTMQADLVRLMHDYFGELKYPARTEDPVD